MPFTTLKVTHSGVFLFSQHEERFRSAGKEAVLAYRNFAISATPGVYNLIWNNQAMQVKQRGDSRLFDGMPVRFMVSPIASLKNRIEKQPPPNVYSNVTKPGFSTLLTSADGSEIYESCAASVIAWDGKSIIMVPSDRPAVKSTMECFINTLGIANKEPVLTKSDYPIALMNAVKGICTVSIEGRKPFPVEQVEKVKKLYEATARRE